jgi:hypothetical protein
MKYLFFALVLMAQVAAAQYVGLTNKEVASLKKLIKKDTSVSNLYSSIKRSADAALNDAPNPIDTVVSEGHLSTDPKKINTGRSLRDINKIYSLGIAYKVEHYNAYLKKLAEFLVAWATINLPQGNPINDTKFEDVFFVYDMVKSELSSSDNKTINSWLSKMADEEIRTGKNKAKTTSFNNWNSHRLKVICCIAYILDNAGYKKYIDEELPIQIEKNLLPDGSGFDFHERDALHYHVYTLEPLISLATVLKRATGKDYYSYVSPSGASIKKSIDFLKPYVTGEKTHGEYVNSKVAFDKKRADNKEAGFEIGANFKPTAAIGVLIEAAYFEPPCMDIARKVLNTKSEFVNWQVVLNKVRR